MLTTQKQVRAAFWQLMPSGVYRQYHGKPQNDCPAAIRTAFVDYVDGLVRNGQISEALAAKVTL
jgi:hypothetical protein